MGMGKNWIKIGSVEKVIILKNNLSGKSEEDYKKGLESHKQENKQNAFKD